MVNFKENYKKSFQLDPHSSTERQLLNTKHEREKKND